MKKKLTKAIIFILLISVTVTSLISLVSCNQKGKAVQGIANVFSSEYLSYPDKFRAFTQGGFRRISFIIGDKIYIVGYNIIDREKWITQPVYYIYDCAENLTYIEPINTYNEDVTVEYAILGSDLAQITVEFDGQSTTLNKRSADGTKLFSVDILKLFDDRSEESVDINKVLTDSASNIYIAGEKMLVITNGEGVIQSRIPFSGPTFRGMYINGSDEVYLEFYDNMYDPVYKTISANKKTLSNPITTFSYKKISTGAGYDAYLYDSSYLYGYNAADDSMTIILDWLESNIDYNTIYNLTVYSPEKITFFERNLLTGDEKFCVSSKTDATVATDKKIINVAYFYDYSGVLSAAALSFNKMNSEYSVKLTSYETPDDYMVGRTRLNSDIAAGNIPDIIMLDVALPVMSYIKKNLFIDLYPLIDADPDISRDDIFNIALSTYDNNGKLYIMPASMSINSLVGKTANVGKDSNWSFYEFKELYDSMHDGKIFWDYLSRTNLVYYSLLSSGITSFVNYEKGVCDFNNQLFYDTIDIIKSFDEKSYVQSIVADGNKWLEFIYDLPYLCTNDELILTSVDSIYNITSMFGLMHRFNFEDITYKGYPTPDGKNALFDMTCAELTITSVSKVKNGAWEFIKYFLSDDVQSVPKYSLPVTKTGLEKLYKIYADDYTRYIDQYGMGIQEYVPEEEAKEKGYTRIVLDDEYYNKMTEFFNKSNMPSLKDSAVYNIINEELDIYFNSDRSAEDISKIIQSRVSLYLNEIN